jgi:pyruvate formate lyase activating enzyme
MTLAVLEPPGTFIAEGYKVGGWWHRANGRVVCDLCPRECSLKDGDAGFCFVRENRGGQIVLNTYGRSTGFCVDPIEKKPLNHFYPGTSVLSFGTAGCNLGCKFCQAWEITKSREVLHLLSQKATPEMIAEAAVRLGCHSVAFTYNDPVIWAEYAIDSARACHDRGLKTIFVTAGYINPEPRRAVFEVMDATNVDLKGFTEDFYQHYTLSHLAPVLDTLCWLHHESQVWLEITNLVIPRANDNLDDIRRMCDWILENLGADVPLHFTAFHPDFRLRDRPPTPPATLVAAREVALQAGLNYVYVGNILDPQRQSTYCPNCRQLLIERAWHDIGSYRIRGGKCADCGQAIAGHFADQPGHWGTRRLPVDPSALLHSLQPSGTMP